MTMKSGEAKYDESHVAECEVILNNHATAMRNAGDGHAALEVVRTTVTRLNDLNERCNSTLIETDQREDICAFIIRVGYLRGVNAEGEDVMEAWRDW
jgi:hypothetical protein